MSRGSYGAIIGSDSRRDSPVTFAHIAATNIGDYDAQKYKFCNALTLPRLVMGAANAVEAPSAERRFASLAYAFPDAVEHMAFLELSQHLHARLSFNVKFSIRAHNDNEYTLLCINTAFNSGNFPKRNTITVRSSRARVPTHRILPGSPYRLGTLLSPYPHYPCQAAGVSGNNATLAPNPSSENYEKDQQC